MVCNMVVMISKGKKDSNMSKSTINILALLVVTLTFCQSKDGFKRIESSLIDQTSLATATQMTNKIMEALKVGGYYQLSKEEATTKMMEAFTESVQRDTYETVIGAFGQYMGVDFAEMAMPTDGTLYEVYRYKGKFESESASVEIRTVLNAQGKLAGFFIIPWKDQM